MAGGMLKDSISVVGTLKKAFLSKAQDSRATIETIVGLAERARREGLLSLEDAAKGIEDDVPARGAADRHRRRRPRGAAATSWTGRSRPSGPPTSRRRKFFADMGGYAPTIGIIGTVIGLVHVLENLSKPDELGHLIAGAFVATLWGVMSANVMWLPLASRLKRVSELECQQMELVVEGILAIQSGTNPRVVQQRLDSLLPPGSVQKEAA